jgi:hypothetical protein
MKREHDDVSRYLNGEVDRKDVPESLRHEVAAFERIVEALGRERVTLPPWVRARVMARVRAAPDPLWRRAWIWATAPRLSPLAGALAAVAVIATVWLWPSTRPSAPSASGPAIAVPIRFVFLAPGAQQVAITGDWVHWDPKGIPLQSAREGGLWAAEIAVPPGLHHYIFIVDGKDWGPDPNVASQVDDGFGQRNSVLLVPAQKVS